MENVTSSNKIGLSCELTESELDAVFDFFDRDGFGCSFGEFAFSFFNRRQMEKRVVKNVSLRV